MATEAQIRAYYAGSGRNWDQACQATVWQACVHFGTAKHPYDSANDARAASRIVSNNPLSAPGGSFHYWSIGRYGHVAGGLGGGRVFMGSKHIDTRWGINVGATTVARYTNVTGARYVGWSTTNGLNDFTFTDLSGSSAADRANVKRIAKYLNGRHLGRTTTAATDGVRGPNYWWLIQTAGRKDGLYPKQYKIDGAPGPKSRELEKHYLAKA